MAGSIRLSIPPQCRHILENCRSVTIIPVCAFGRAGWQLSFPPSLVVALRSGGWLDVMAETVMPTLKVLSCLTVVCVMSSLSCDLPQGREGSKDLNDGTSGCTSMFVSAQSDRDLARPEMRLARFVDDEEIQCRGSSSGLRRLFSQLRYYKVC